MSYYDHVGACPPYGGYPSYGQAFGPPAYAPPAYPLAGPQQFGEISGFPYYDLIGQPAPPPATDPAAQPGIFTRARTWLAQEGPLGVTRQNWLLGATALGTIWYAYSAGWFGAMGGSKARDFW